MPVESTFEFLAVLTQWALTLYGWIIIIAILISWVNPDPGNPIVRFLHRMTDPLWNYLREILPGSLTLFAAYISLLLVMFLEIFLPGVLRTMGDFSAGALSLGQTPTIVAGFFLLGIAVVARSLLYFLIILLLIWFFLTLINPSINNPIVRTVYILVDPFITPIQRRLPRQKIDLSPLLAAGVFLLLNQLLLGKLIGYAFALTRGHGLLSALPPLINS